LIRTSCRRPSNPRAYYLLVRRDLPKSSPSPIQPVIPLSLSLSLGVLRAASHPVSQSRSMRQIEKQTKRGSSPRALVDPSSSDSNLVSPWPPFIPARPDWPAQHTKHINLWRCSFSPLSPGFPIIPRRAEASNGTMDELGPVSTTLRFGGYTRVLKPLSPSPAQSQQPPSGAHTRFVVAQDQRLGSRLKTGSGNGLVPDPCANQINATNLGGARAHFQRCGAL
jgi:hypothetical protein